jgi:alanyl-tRNA synthetase
LLLCFAQLASRQTARHHTFFEMLGNFSIGAYFKEEAMVLAWEFLTKELQLPASRLRISVLHNDDESAQLWSKLTGFTETSGRVVRMGEADNFWSMGDGAGTPCGPCSEIFFDQGAEVDGERFLEIWNLVFMQFARGATPNELLPLAKPCVDTGMGLERLAAVMQGKPTNYDSDALRPLIAAVEQLVAERAASSSNSRARNSNNHSKPLVLTPYTNGLDQSPSSTALKVIVDHLRSAAFLVAEGVTPSNLGRGYVLRRIIRRAVRYGHQHLGLSAPFLSALLPALQASLGKAYPEIVERGDSIAAVLQLEEAAFFATLGRGLQVLEEAFARHQAAVSSSATAQGQKPTLPGEVAFQLYDTFGFPLDLTQLIARERFNGGSSGGGGGGGWDVDVARFEQLMRAQKEQSKAGSAFQAGGVPSSSAAASHAAAAAGVSSAHVGPTAVPAAVKKWQHDGLTNTFVGYEALEVAKPRVVAALFEPSSNEEEAGGTLWLSLAESPFYANAGGQVGDVGVVELDAAAAAAGTKEAVVALHVLDCVRAYEGLSVLRVAVPPRHAALVQRVQGGSVLHAARVSRSHRDGVAAHHTATHLLHAALKAVLGAPAATPASPSSSDKKVKQSAAVPLSAAAINQAGSLVSSERLRFDFSCPVALSATQVDAVEKWVNEAILTSAAEEHQTGQSPRSAVSTAEMAREEALRLNAMSLFGEKYGERVRVVRIGSHSLELCGGTHAASVRQCYPFKILSEAGIATGMRRLEAVAGVAAVRMLESSHVALRKVASDLKAPPTPEAATTALAKLQQRAAELEAQLALSKKQSLLENAESRARKAVWVLDAAQQQGGSAKVEARVLEVAPDIMADGVLLRSCCTALQAAAPQALHVLLCSSTGSVAVTGGTALPLLNATAAATSPIVSAKAVFARLQASLLAQGASSAGKGGGSPQLAIGVLPLIYNGTETTLTLTDRVVKALADVNAKEVKPEKPTKQKQAAATKA